LSRSIRDFLLPKVFGLFLIFLLGMPLWLILDGYFSDPPKKIYPKGGMFIENRTYNLDCFVEKGRNEIRSDYLITFNKRNNYVALQEKIGIVNKEWKSREVEVTENYEGEMWFETFTDIFWLNVEKGTLSTSAHDSGFCIEEGWRWYINEDNNTFTYERDRELMK
tara:strand:- start:784 stop:1278 length:495 start_codon:yes stop_codon:yes gene_type:complete